MKKITNVAFLFISFFNMNFIFGQIVAEDDYFYTCSFCGGGNTFINILSNDMLDGVNGLNQNNVIITSPGNNFDSDGTFYIPYNSSGSCGGITLTYTITRISNPSEFDTASIFIDYYDPPFAGSDFYTVNPGFVGVLGYPNENDWACGLSFNPNFTYIESLPNGIIYNYNTGNIEVTGYVVSGTYIIQYESNSDAGNVNGMITIEVLPSLTLSMTGTYSDFNADGFTNVGDVINYQFTVSNLSDNNLSNVSVSDSSMSISGTTIPILPAGATDTTTFTGVHVLTLVDIMAGSVTEDASITGFDSLSALISNSATTTTSLGITDAIKMNTFIDLNSNNIQEAGEPNFTNGEFHYDLNGDGILRNIIDSSGMFTIYETNPANLYNLSYTINPAFVSVYNPLTVVYSGVNVATGSGVTTYNFPITEIPFTDLSISLIPGGAPVPGFSYSNIIRYENKGTSTIASGVVTFNHGSNVSIYPVAGSTPITNGFTLPFTNLLRHEVRYQYVNVLTPVIPTVSLGDLVTNSASINIPPGDIHPLDNTFTITQVVRGSYDPNDKMETHGEKIVHSTFRSSDYLTYTIRFENTGTGNAINIKVDDVLDTQLDATSIRMIDASAPYILERTGNNLSWKFNGINLPPSIASTETGKGYITFQVKPTAGYAIGDIIPNTANIYFDFNPAIVTNTFLTEFVSTLATAKFDNAEIKIFPNPTSNILNINTSSIITSIEIVDINGRIIQSLSQNSNEVVLNIENFQSGMYLLKVTTEKGSSIEKIIKK